jgi:D-cysteine desulfhydrase
MARGTRRAAAARPVPRRTFIRAGLGAAALLLTGGGAGEYAARRLNLIGVYPPGRLAELRGGASTLLFERYPGLADSVPWRPLATLPTPVEALPRLDGARDVNLLVKRDDGTSPLYGGNKVRKLEHYLAEAELAERRTLVTMGGVGTNHGLATAVHGGRLGFAVRLALYEQPPSPYVARNLRGFVGAGADLRYGGGELGALLAVRRLYAQSEAEGDAPYFIMPGGSSRLGSIGHVNAALELAEQVRAGVLPEPDRIFVALGSCGTAAGLIVGCRLAGLRTRVAAVRVTPAVVANRAVLHYMASDVARYLRASSPAVPRVRIGVRDFDVVASELGRGYGEPTPAAAAALAWAAPQLELEPTYTAKALAACLAHCRDRARPGETVLFWNTANAAPVEEADSVAELPAALRRHLETSW